MLVKLTILLIVTGLVCFIKADFLKLLGDEEFNQEEGKLNILLENNSEIFLSYKINGVRYTNRFDLENLLQQNPNMKVFDDMAEIYVYIKKMSKAKEIIYTKKGSEFE